MKEFRIGVYEEMSGFVVIKAKNITEAEDIVNEILESDGVSGFDNFDIKHRSVEIL